MKTILSHRKQKPSPAMPEPAEAKPPKYTPRGIQSKNRILLAVKDGQIDFSAMSRESAKQVNDLMHSPDVQAQFNIGPLKDKFDPRHCKRIYEAVAVAEITVAKFAFKWPSEALRMLLFTEEEKDELAVPTAAALDELAPKWLRENQAVAALLLVFAAIEQKKFQEASAVAREIQRQRLQMIVRPPAAAGAQESTQEERFGSGAKPNGEPEKKFN